MYPPPLPHDSLGTAVIHTPSLPHFTAYMSSYQDMFANTYRQTDIKHTYIHTHREREREMKHTHTHHTHRHTYIHT